MVLRVKSENQLVQSGHVFGWKKLGKIILDIVEINPSKLYHISYSTSARTSGQFPAYSTFVSPVVSYM